uniref:Refilin B n=1 Tax=Mus spicilegus TaxID=10103 RepID=A0A8C6I0F3_MUSSI
MVGRLSLQDVPELVDTKKKGDGVLDSPDSGLPPSPSPSHWGLAATAGGGGERAPVAGTLEPDAAVTPIVPNPASLTHSLAAICSPRLCPLSFGEGVEFDPLPPKEIKYTSSVKYDSERHFIDDVQMPLGLVVASCSQTVTCIPNCTWRNYKEPSVNLWPLHTYTHIHIQTYTYIHTDILTDTCTHVHTHTHTYICTHRDTHRHTYIHKDTHT